MMTTRTYAAMAVLVLFGGLFAERCRAAEGVKLRYKGEENVSYLVQGDYREVERAGEGETETLNVRALVRYGRREPKPHGPIRLTPKVYLLSIGGNMEKEKQRYMHPERPKPAFRPLEWVYPLGPVERRLQVQVIAKEFDGLPLFPDNSVEAGDSWQVIQRLAPSSWQGRFLATVDHVLAGHVEEDGDTYAEVRYTLSGTCKSADHPEMLIDNYMKEMKPECTLSGEGTALFDPVRGIVVKKQQHVEYTVRTTGKPSPALLREWPGLGPSDRLRTSQITVTLVSEEEAAKLMQEAEAFRASLPKPEPPAPEPPAKWTYHVEREIVQRQLARTRTWVDRALVGYGAARPKVVYVDEDGDPTGGGAEGPPIQPRQQEKLFLTAKLPEFGGPGSGQAWPAALIARSMDALPLVPEGDLTPDRRWTSEVEMTIYPTPETEFTATIEQTSRGYEERHGRRCLKIEYALTGKFSAADHPERFSAEDLKEFRSVGSLSGTGVAYVDVEEGILVEKEQTVRWTSLDEHLRRLEDGKIGWVPFADVEEQTEIKVSLEGP